MVGASPERVKGGLPRRKPPAPDDVRGLSFGSLTAVRYVGLVGENDAVWQCRCRCGARRDAALSALRAGTTRSCPSCAPPPPRKPPSNRALADALRAEKIERLRMERQMTGAILPPQPLITDEEMARLYAPFGGANAYGGQNEVRLRDAGRNGLPAPTHVQTRSALA
jgi:hypothetical protein